MRHGLTHITTSKLTVTLRVDRRCQITLHVGRVDGWVEGADLAFRSKTISKEYAIKWTVNISLNGRQGSYYWLEEPSVIILDNVSYHRHLKWKALKCKNLSIIWLAHYITGPTFSYLMGLVHNVVLSSGDAMWSLQCAMENAIAYWWVGAYSVIWDCARFSSLNMDCHIISSPCCALVNIAKAN